MTKRKKYTPPQPLTATHEGRAATIVGCAKVGYNQYQYLIKYADTREYKWVAETAVKQFLPA